MSNGLGICLISFPLFIWCSYVPFTLPALGHRELWWQNTSSVPLSCYSHESFSRNRWWTSVFKKLINGPWSFSSMCQKIFPRLYPWGFLLHRMKVTWHSSLRSWNCSVSDGIRKSTQSKGRIGNSSVFLVKMHPRLVEPSSAQLRPSLCCVSYWYTSHLPCHQNKYLLCSWLKWPLPPNSGRI